MCASFPDEFSFEAHNLEPVVTAAQSPPNEADLQVTEADKAHKSAGPDGIPQNMFQFSFLRFLF